MKKKVSALVIAIGFATTPVFAKPVNKRQQKTESSNSHANSETIKKRLANTFKRLNLKKAEKELLKETQAEITTALKYKKVITQNKVKRPALETLTVHKDKLPNRGIDLTKYINLLSIKNSS